MECNAIIEHMLVRVDAPTPASFRVSGFGLRVSGFGFQVSGFGFRVEG